MIIILVMIIIFCIMIFNYKNIENMTNVVPYSNEDELTPNLKTKCCLVEKKYLPDNTNIYGGNFKYLYTNKENEQCNPLLYESNNNQQLLIDGMNNWSNQYCSDNTDSKTGKKLGSCRMINNECIDFVDKKYCDTINGMVWSDKTCNNPLEYVWKDRIVRNVPEKDKNDGTYVMFPEKYKKF